MTTHFTVCSNRGPREVMEDSALAFSIPRSTMGLKAAHVLLVLDGVGSRPGGAIASAQGALHLGASAFTMLAAWAIGLQCTLRNSDDQEEALRQMFEMANQAICDQSELEPALKGMATTAVCSMVIGDTLVTGWVGDSRCYVADENGLRQITHDHSRVQMLIDRGEINSKEATSHPDAHAITRYLGQPVGFVPETVVNRLRPGDLVVQCSDGLTGGLSDAEVDKVIAELRAGRLDFQHLAVELVQRAIDSGTQDNTTAICYRHGIDFCNLNWNRTCTAAYAKRAAIALNPKIKEKPDEFDRSAF